MESQPSAAALVKLRYIYLALTSYYILESQTNAFISVPFPGCVTAVQSQP